MNNNMKIIALILVSALVIRIPENVFAKTLPAEASLSSSMKENDKICNFTVKSVTEFETFDAVVTVLEHDKTKACVEIIKNDDPNRCFMLEFGTRTYDDKGTPHVFEHAVTNGSKKYPSRSLTQAIYSGSYLTYGNASTGDRNTVYPIATLSERQLLKFADYYTDMCFEPLILENEDIFKTEASRYMLSDEAAPIELNGTIYSEMRGRYTASRMAVRKAMGLAKPGCAASYESGGIPEDILKLTYEEVRDYHEKYYHPSNCTAYLYGDIRDTKSFLTLLDGYFGAYDGKEIKREDAKKQAAGFFEKKYEYPAPADSPADGRSSIVYAMDLGQLSDEELRLLYAIRAYCDRDTSVLNLRLGAMYPAASFSVKVDTDETGSVLYITADYMNENDSKIFRDTIDRIFNDIAKRGLSTKDIDNFRRQMRLENVLAREGANTQVSMLLGVSSMRSSGRGPLFYMNMIDGYSDMREFDNDLIKNFVKDHMTSPARSALVTVVPRPGLLEENEKKLREELAKKKAGMTKEEIRELVRETKRITESATDDPTKYLEMINVITPADLPDTLQQYVTSDRTDRAGTRKIGVYTKNAGINSTQLFLDASGLPQEDLCYMSLFADLVNGRFVPAGDLSGSELAQRVNEVMPQGEDISFTVSSTGDEYTSYLTASFMCEPCDNSDAFELLRAQLFESDFSDTERIAAGIEAIRNTIRRSVNAHPENLMRYLTLAADGDGAAYYEYTHYIEYYDFLAEVLKKIEKDPKSVSDKLSRMGQYVNNRNGAVLGYVLSPESKKDYLEKANAFFDELENCDRAAVKYDLPKYRYPLAVITNRQTVYNAIGTGDVVELGMKKDLPVNALALSIIAEGYIRPQARDRYGAYGYSFRYDDSSQILFTADDPNTKETMEIFDGIGNAWGDLTRDMKKSTLDARIVTMYSKETVRSGDISLARALVNDIVAGERADHEAGRLQKLKKITVNDLRKLDDAMDRFSQNGRIVTIGSPLLINRNSNYYAEVIRPFE